MRPEPEASNLVQIFYRRMHNRPDPNSTSEYIPLAVQLTKDTGKPLSTGEIIYQMGESSEDFFPESMRIETSGQANIPIPVPAPDRVHITARVPGYAPSSVVLPGAEIIAGTRKSVQLTLSRSLKIGGTVVDEANYPLSNVQVRIRVEPAENSAPEIRPWDELVQTAADGMWTADFVPATVLGLTIIFYRNPGAPETVVLNRTKPGFEELT